MLLVCAYYGERATGVRVLRRDDEWRLIEIVYMRDIWGREWKEEDVYGRSGSEIWSRYYV